VPAKSRAQMRKMFALAAEGAITKTQLARFTPTSAEYKRLPERKAKKSMARKGKAKAKAKKKKKGAKKVMMGGY